MIRRRGPGLTRGAAALTALAALVSFGAGCTPAPKGVLAVERAADGGARLLLADCPGYLAKDFSVLADTDTGGTGGGGPAAWSVHNGGWTSSVRAIRLFQNPPAGWRATGSELTALREGVPYVATVSGAMGERSLKGRVPFTAADLAGLGNGQVLASDGGDGNTTMGRDDFLRGDPDRCRP
ncbi:hypothetical protein [Sphaerisporangium rhizosphaerae]|uniref:Lipoprotein n=1 Tax=Sphaerisporangium rhizosphaerae TaxID=2269375 RepID=A0ABW2P248_9ACTN